MTNNDQEFLVQKIRTQYTEKQHTELDALKELDAKVKRPANVFAYTYGSVSAVVMGAGMSFVMTEIGAIIGIMIGIIGMILVALAYPLYNRVLRKNREKIAPEILRLTDELLK